MVENVRIERDRMAKCLAERGLALPEKRGCLSCLAKRDPALQDKTTKLYMFYVYILQSSKNKDVYVGFTNDLRNRFALHNSGKVKSTKTYRPWILAYYEAYRAKPDATKREKELKIHAAKNELLRRLQESLI